MVATPSRRLLYYIDIVDDSFITVNEKIYYTLKYQYIKSRICQGDKMRFASPLRRQLKS